MLQRIIALLAITVLTAPAFAREEVKIGVYHFPPFVNARLGSGVGGAVVDVVDAFNRVQDKYHFTITTTTPEGRYDAFKMNWFDLLIFESIKWGWSDEVLDASDVFLEGGEVYIARKKQARDQSYFSDFSDKTMIGIAGYHYGFAGFNSDPEYLRQTFNMFLTKSNVGSIKMVLAGNRGDIAVVTQSFLNQYMNQHPAARDKLLISEKLDQPYHHTILVRKGINLRVEEINAYLNKLQQSGELDRIWKGHGIR